MARRAFAYSIGLGQVGPVHDPAFLAAPPAVRAEVLGWVVAYGLKAKDEDLAAGLDRRGKPLAPILPLTRRYRTSAMGPADPDAPPLTPAYAVSRTRLLLAGEAKRTTAEFYWEYDEHTGASWGQVLDYQRKGVGKRKTRRDVIGLSPAGLAKVRQWVAARWLEFKRHGLRTPERAASPGPPTPPPRTIPTGDVDFGRYTFGVNAGGAGGAAATRRALTHGLGVTGFRQRGPGQGRTAYGGPDRGGPVPAPPPAKPAVPLEIHGDPSPAFAGLVRGVVDALPLKAAEALKRFGVRVKAGRGMGDVNPSLVNERPNGWGPHDTWDDSDGVYLKGDRTAYVVETVRAGPGPGAGRVEGGRHEGVAWHEIGHAVDHALGLPSQSPAFERAYDADAAGLDPAARPSLAYFLRPFGVGREEVFAELFAQQGKAGTAPEDFPKLFPRSAELVRGLTR